MALPATRSRQDSRGRRVAAKGEQLLGVRRREDLVDLAPYWTHSRRAPAGVVGSRSRCSGSVPRRAMIWSEVRALAPTAEIAERLVGEVTADVVHVD